MADELVTVQRNVGDECPGDPPLHAVDGVRLEEASEVLRVRAFASERAAVEPWLNQSLSRSS